MKTIFLYIIKPPRSMITEFTTDTEYAEFKSKAGFEVNARRLKVITNGN